MPLFVKGVWGVWADRGTGMPGKDFFNEIKVSRMEPLQKGHQAVFKLCDRGQRWPKGALSFGTVTWHNPALEPEKRKIKAVKEFNSWVVSSSPRSSVTSTPGRPRTEEAGSKSQRTRWGALGDGGWWLGLGAGGWTEAGKLRVLRMPHRAGSDRYSPKDCKNT